MRNKVRNLAYWLSYKWIDEKKIDILQIRLSSKDIRYFNLSTNSILSFIYDKQLYYFRECPMICSQNEYFTNAINNFWGTLKQLGINKGHFMQEIPVKLDFSENEISMFRLYIGGKKVDRYFQKSMLELDVLFEAESINIWNLPEMNSEFFERFGLQCLPENLIDIAIYFLWYMRSAALNYRTLNIVRGNKYSYFSAMKSYVSRIVAEELGLAHMVTDIRWCKLDIDGKKTRFGLLCEAALGARMKDSIVEAEGSLQREMLNLNVLDTILFQVDHGPNNYNVFRDENGNYSVCAFDNDNPYTLLPIPRISYPLGSYISLVNNKGIINRPYFDRELAEKLYSLNIKGLKQRLKPYLNKLQIYTLIYRIELLKKAIIQTQNIRSQFLLEPNEWNVDTIQEEIEGMYGETYLLKALRKE